MARPADEITLLLAPGNVEAQCLEAIRQSRNASHALAALIALQSVISATAHPSDRHTPAYDAVKAVVEKHAAEIRKQILAEHADALTGAIRQRNCPEIARIHSALSRNGFWQAAQHALQQFDQGELDAAAAWARDWCGNAKSRAQAASGFPEALDFRKAGISPAEYAAMTEVGKYLENQAGL